MIALEPHIVPACDERIEIVGQIEHVHFLLDVLAVHLALEFEFLAGLENLRGRTAGNDGLELAPVAQAAAERGIVDEFADRGLADFDLVIAGALHLAAEADDARAGVVRRAELGEFRAAHRDDVLHVAERLDVVDDGRAHVEPEHGREIRRLDARIGPLAFERFDEAGFLAADVSARAAMDVNLQIVAAAENVLAEEILRAAPPSSAWFRSFAPSGISPRM